jgi:hypothetical protein
MGFLRIPLIVHRILKDPIDVGWDSIDFAPDPYGSHRFSMGFLRIQLILHRIPQHPIDFASDS